MSRVRALGRNGTDTTRTIRTLVVPVNANRTTRGWASRLAAVIAVAAALGRPEGARATGALGTPGIEPIEQRFAIAVGPSSTTIWTSLAFDGPTGSVAVVLPVPVGTALDTSSRAFFEALEVATAPRVVPPQGAQAMCAGEAPGTGVALDEDLGGKAPLSPVEMVTFVDAPSLESWAAAHGLVVSQSTLAALATFDPSTRFVAMRYDAPGGPALTTTLRAVLPGAVPVAPLVLTAAKSAPLRVVTWEIGPGRGHLGGTEVEVDLDKLAFDVSQSTSNYAALRNGILVDQQHVVVESASHEALRDNLAIGTTQESIDGFAKTYFSRAKTYGDTTGDPIACTFQSAVVLGQTAKVSAACPRADLGFVEMGTSCVESVQTGEVDPQKLRCVGVTDDLALMLSGLAGKDAWLTRSTLLLPAGKLGADLPITFPTGPRRDPIYEATSVDLSGCGGGSSSSTSTGNSMGSGPPPSGVGGGSSGTMVDVPLYQYSGCSCNGAYEQVGYVVVDSNNAPSSYYETSSGCSNDTTTYDTTPDSCSGDSSTSGDNCGSTTSDSTSGDSCSNNDGSSGCSGDSSAGSDSCNSGSGDGCGSSGSSDSCSNNCAVAKDGRPHKGRRLSPRLSGLVYGLVALLVPLRRWMRPNRKKRPKVRKRARRR